MKFKNYIHFIKKFKNSGYKFKLFNEKFSRKSTIILRHDVDFDLDYALQMAEIEKKLKVKSTYFFLTGSNFYNLFNVNNLKKILKIKKLGHSISVHFDPNSTKSDKILSQLKEDKKLFENLFKTKIYIISFHRPPKNYINLNTKINGLNHTYQNKFTKKIKYFADSRNTFRHGNPIYSEAFEKKMNMQILIHPIWWIDTFKKSTTSKLKNFVKKKYYNSKSDLLENLPNTKFKI